MRLGDLDALKETIKNEAIDDHYHTPYIFIDKLNQLIDNAPTVAVDEEIERQREELYQSCKKLFDTARMLGVERPQGEWIPVSERLPEIDVDVIVTDIETTGTYSACYVGDGFWDCDNGVFNNRVIAWQPLPEPYKGPHDHSDAPIRCKAENCSPEGCKHCSGYGLIESGGDEDAEQ